MHSRSVNALVKEKRNRIEFELTESVYKRAKCERALINSTGKVFTQSQRYFTSRNNHVEMHMRHSYRQPLRISAHFFYLFRK